MPNTATTTECPPLSELERLVRGRCTEARANELCEHVGVCPACQARLESLSGSVGEVAEHLRTAEQHLPPRDSAYWRIIENAENEIHQTILFNNNHSNGQSNNSIAGNTPVPQNELKLDFLQPTDKPNLLGRLSQFDILRVVGRGGMGVVLHAYDPSLARDVAIKVIDPELANNEVARQRFCREARAAAAVTHDNLVAVHQVNEDEPSGLPYLVMQLVNGESLEQRIKRAGKMSAGEVAKLGMQAAAGLAAAHKGGLIHRDIKPANILLESGGDRVKLTDFGLARAAEDVKLTRTGFVAGSPLYMAPEQARGDEVDLRGDLFSLGTVLYEAATGTAPFEAKTPLAVLRRVSDETQMPLVRINPDIPQWLSDAVDKLLQKDPKDRYQSANEVAEVFAAGLSEMRLLSPLDVPAEVCSGSRTGTARTRKHVCWKSLGCRVIPWVGGALAGTILVGTLGLLFHSDQPPANNTPPDQTNNTPQIPSPGESIGPKPTAILAGESGAVWAITFLKDDRLVMGMESGTLKIWDWKKRTVSKSLDQPEGGNGNIWSADASANGKYLMTATDDSAVTVWNLQTYQVELSFPESISTKTAIFCPDGRYLATGNRNSAVKIWDWSNQVAFVELRHRGTIHSLAYSPDGKSLASASSDGKVKVWDLREVNWERREGPVRSMNLAEHKGAVYSVTYSPDGTKIASSGWDGFVRIWDASNGTQLQAIKAHDYDAWSVSFGNDGKWVASAGSDGGVRVWDVETGKEVFSYRGPRAFHVAKFAPDGTTLAAGGRDGTVKVWELQK
jgi:serine/threonine protein kinase